MRMYLLAAATFAVGGGPISGADLAYKQRVLDALVKQVPGILKAFDPATGRLGSGIWICEDQHLMYALAVAYATKGERNPYFKDPELLRVIVKSGDPLIQEMDERGQWVFRKKDGSTWGKIWMPWTYSRWIRTFGLIREAMPEDSRKAWTDALVLGYTGISGTQLGSVHNIPAHHAMGLYAAGKVLDRPEWCEQAAAFMLRVAAAQSEGGYWSEGEGPVVAYNFVYVDALGTYHAMSGDRRVLPALEKAAAYHKHFTYPNGHSVETIDQRNPYSAGVHRGNVGFTFTPVGRSYLDAQWSRDADPNPAADLSASLLLYGEEGPKAPPPDPRGMGLFVMTEGGEARAMTARRGPWFICLSAYTTPVSTSRWIQDRQNMASIFHDRTGLILGGGNTKLQPAWSSFTVGDTALLKHTPGDTDPAFVPKGELYHVPREARLVREPDLGLDLRYGPELCRIRVAFIDERKLEYAVESTAESGLPVVAHLTLIPHLGQSLETAAGSSVRLDATPVELSAAEVGGRISHAGYRLHLPASASLAWPALPHNPYRKDGRATVEEARVEIRIPLGAESRSARVLVEITDGR